MIKWKIISITTRVFVHEDPTDTFLQRVSAWSQKWLSEGEINDTVVDFVTNHSAQSAKNDGLVKTHNYKSGCKFRVITEGSNSTRIHLSAFTEMFHSQEHILVDTTDFLNFVNLLKGQVRSKNKLSSNEI